MNIQSKSWALTRNFFLPEATPIQKIAVITTIAIAILSLLALTIFCVFRSLKFSSVQPQKGQTSTTPKKMAGDDHFYSLGSNISYSKSLTHTSHQLPTQPVRQQTLRADSLKDQLLNAKLGVEDYTHELQKARNAYLEAKDTLDVMKFTSTIDQDFKTEEQLVEKAKVEFEHAHSEFRKSFKTYLESLGAYIVDSVKQYKHRIENDWQTAKDKNDKFNKERSYEIYEYVAILSGLFERNSENESFIQEALFRIDDFLETTFFTNPNERCLNEQMKMDLIVFQEFFTIVEKHFHLITDMQLAQRLKIKLANLPLNDCGINATMKRADFPTIYLSEDEQKEIMLEHFHAAQGSQKNLATQAIKLFETQMGVPRWYHATKYQALKPIIQSGNIKVLKMQQYLGAWVSNRWEEQFGSHIIAFNHKITEIDDGKVFIGYEKGYVNWRGIQKPIPLVNTVLIGVQYDSEISTIRELLKKCGIHALVVNRNLLSYIQKEILKVIGNPNLNANWWGAANFEHLETAPQII